MAATEATRKDLDILEKRRLASRRFGFVRHHVYRTKALVEAPETAPDYASDDDRHNKDSDSSLRAAHEARKKKEGNSRALRSVRQAYKEQKLHEERETEWQKKLQHDHYLKVKPQYRNKAGVPYNIVNMEYDENYDGLWLKYLEERAVWREGMRRVRLNSKMSGNRNYDVITWQKREPMKPPEEPPPFIHRPPPRPSTALPPPPYVPVVAVEAPRPYSALTPRKSDASESYHWDINNYRNRPYRFK